MSMDWVEWTSHSGVCYVIEYDQNSYVVKKDGKVILKRGPVIPSVDVVGHIGEGDLSGSTESMLIHAKSQILQMEASE